MGVYKTVLGLGSIQIRFVALLIACLFAGLFALAFDTPSQAATTLPTKMNFQGRLTNSAGVTLTNGTYNMKFKIWSAASGGAEQWSEDRLVSASQGVTVTNGQFSVQLGSVTSLPASVFASNSLYFEVELPTPGSATTSSPVWTEGAMTPRNQLATSAYAYNSETLDGLDSAAFGQLGQNNTFTGNNTFNGTLQGGSSLTLGTAATQGSLVLNDGNGQTGTLVMADTAGSYTYTIPVATANDTFCLQTLANCGAGGGISTVGALDGGTANATGASIVGTTVYLQSASTGNAGLVNTATQSFAGNKTFTGTVTVNSSASVSGDLTVAGGFTQTGVKLSLKASLAANAATGFPRETEIVGNYAYVINEKVNGPFSIIDISNPSAPAVVSSITDSLLNAARDIRVVGRYAYVVSFNGEALVVIDVANPAAPAIVGSVTDATNFMGVHGLEIQGKYAYATATLAGGSGRLTVVDISNPAAPTIATSITGTQLNQSKQIDINGKYAYVTNGGGVTGGLAVVDISNPLSPSIVGSALSANFTTSRDVVMNGKFAYVVGAANDYFGVFDVSNPASPTLVGSLQDSTNMDEPFDITLSGSYAYVTSRTSSNIAVVDITNPTAPSIVPGAGYTASGISPTSATLKGRYLYVNGNTNSSVVSQFLVLDTAGTSLGATSTNTLSTNTLLVDGGADVADTLNVGDSLNVGQGGIQTTGALTGGSASFGGAIQGGSSITLGSASAQGSLVLNDGNGQTGTIRIADTAGSYIYTIPVTTANDTFCLQTLANCGAGGGVSTVGALDGGTANATGASIVGSTLYLQSASATNAGLINTTTQTFAGNKTFNGTLTVANSASFSGQLTIGVADTTGTLLVLDTKTSAGDPAGTNGAMYYNSNLSKFRCYQAGAWIDCTLGEGLIRKTADQSATQSSVTFQNVTDMTVPLAVTSTYSFEANLYVTVSDATADFKFTITAPTGATLTGLGQSTTGSTAATTCTLLSVTGTSCPVASTVPGRTLVRITGLVTTVATAGSLQVQFAQNVSTAVSTPTALANSTIRYIKLQ
ncbi:MAG: hypothetical protein V4678_01565 [Patescibacteria group bacterium]